MLILIIQYITKHIPALASARIKGVQHNQKGTSGLVEYQRQKLD